VEPEYLLERMGWLVQLRWFAVGGVLVTVVCAAILRVVDEVVPLLGVTIGLATFNTYAWSRWRRSKNENSSRVLAHRVFWQLVGDLLALALLLHFSGGAENPFAMFFAFHMALGAMLLPGTLPIYLGIIAALLQGLVVLGEFAGALAHYSLFTVRPGPAFAHQALLWRTPGFVVGYLVAFTMMLFGVIYFVRSVVERQRRAEELRRERERLARIGEITAGVAHAVQNPLHGLINSVDLLIARAAADAATKETLLLMGEACRRIESVTQRLLVLTRDAPVAKKTVRLETLVRESVALAWP
jgi:two-component system sensor histidine kinase RegB